MSLMGHHGSAHGIIMQLSHGGVIGGPKTLPWGCNRCAMALKTQPGQCIPTAYHGTDMGRHGSAMAAMEMPNNVHR